MTTCKIDHNAPGAIPKAMCRTCNPLPAAAPKAEAVKGPDAPAKPENPLLAFACPSCTAKAGQWCRRPSGHRAMELHKARREVYELAQAQEKAEPVKAPDVSAKAATGGQTNEESKMRSRSKKARTTAHVARKGPTKREQVVDLVCRASGATLQECAKKIGWSVVNRSTLMNYCKEAGVKVRVDDKVDPVRFFGTRAKANAA